MQTLHSLTFLCVCLALPLSAQIPNTLLHSVPAPFGTAQTGAKLGYSVAMDGGYTVVGAPYDSTGSTYSGVAKVFDSASGSLLFVLPNPSPEYDDSFGWSVAISGTRVVVGAYRDDTGVADAGSAYVYDLSGSMPTVPVTTLNNPSPEANDNFGWSVAISGTKVVVGAYLDDTGAADAGSAYVYDLSGTTPTVPVVTLNNPSPGVSDYFGHSVAIAGTRVAVGAHRDDSIATNAGTVYVYDLTNGTPTSPIATLNNLSPTAANDQFGVSVAISGSQLIVGAYRDNEGSAFLYDLGSATPTVPITKLNNPSPLVNSDFGWSVGISGTRVIVGADVNEMGVLVHIYDVTSGTPTVPIHSLSNPTPVVNDFFGFSVAISGSRVVVGAYQDDTGATNAGSAYVYDLNSGTPTVPTTTLNNPGSSVSDHFGNSVAISGNLMVVGAYQDDTGAPFDAGSAYVYNVSSGIPAVLVATLNNPSPQSDDHFGYSVAISGTHVVIGSPYDDTLDSDSGSVYIYDMTSATPTVPVATLNNPTPSNDHFGTSVAISGKLVVVGSSQNFTGTYSAGSAYVYDLNSATPTVPVVTLNNPSPASFDYFGASVAISGMRVVVGALLDDSGTIDAGSAYVYDLSNGTPTVPVATLNNPSPAIQDNFGHSVAISGTRVVVGAYRDDTGASNSGSAYVYDMSSSTPTVPAITLNNPGPAADDYFGISAAISGTQVVIGASNNNAGITNAGSVYIYDLGSGTPTVPVVTLNNPGPAAGDAFGASVAIDGAMVAIGTPNDDTVNFDKGYAYVFGPTPFPDIAVEQASPLTDGSGSVAFGSFESGSSSAPLTFTIRNSGTAPLTGLSLTKSGTNAADFTVSALSGTSIPVGADTATFTVTFSPSSTGAKTAALQIASNVTGAKNPFNINLTGTGLLSSNANLSGLSLSGLTLSPAFAAETLSYTAEAPNSLASIMVTPVKADALALAQVRVNGGNYNLPSSPLALNVGVNTVDVRVTAQNSSTMKTYTITVTRAVGPEVAISGNGVGIVDGDVSSSAVDGTHFGALAVASGTKTHTFTIANTGALALNLSGTPKVQISGAHAADFQVSVMPDSPVASTSSTTFQIAFDPSVSGLRTAMVSVESDDADENPYTFVISGTGRIGSQATQTLAFEAPKKLHLAESPFTLSASSSSGLPVAYTVVSGPATVSGDLLTFTGAGAVKVRASQSGDAEFMAATPVERTITVTADPTTLTLTNLSQTFTGTPRPITVLGSTGEVDVTYKVGLSYTPTAPTNAGSYAVKAVAGTVSKTGTLVITKAPLFVTPDDQRKFAGQANPVLGFGYEGFLGGDSASNSVSKAPVIATTATATSPGGLYPIIASGGTSANYLFVYMKGTMKVETFADSYEAMLVDAGTQRPAAKLELTVAATGKTFSAKLTTPTETAVIALTGTLTTNILSETATGTATVKKGANTYLLTVTLPLTGDFTAETKLNGSVIGNATNGKKLLTLAKGQTLSYTGTHSALLAPALPAGVHVPAGAGWAVASIDAKGLLKLTGKLADGTGLTASLAADVSSNPGYRLFIQPYTPARTGAFLAGAFELKPHPDLAGRRFVAFEDAAEFTWVKAPRQTDPSYRAGFGPVDTRLTLDPWLPPALAKKGVPAISLAQRLGLTANQFTAQHSTISSASFADLPTILGLNAATNAVSVVAPVTTPLNITKWKVTLTPATGAFAGSFELNDAGKKRSVPFAGMMRQPATTDTSGIIGDGNFLLPSLSPAPNNEVLSGEVGFER